MKLVLQLMLNFAFIYGIIAKCNEHGTKESFILSMNSRPVTSIYNKIFGSTFVDCRDICLADQNCKSLSFLKSKNESECYLMMEDQNQRHHQQVIPVLGSFYMEKACLKGACDRLFVAESIRGMELEGHDDIVLQSGNRFACLESCFTTKEIFCRSVEYDSKTSQCRLSRYDRFSRKVHFKKSSSATLEYLDVTCPYENSAMDRSSSSAEIVLLGNVEHPYILEEHRGLNAAECGELCMQTKRFPCRSFLSGRLENELYCGLTHQNREGLVQNPGSLHASRSLNYYEIARNVEGCDASDLHFEMMTGTVLNVNPYMVTSDLTPKECLEQCKSDRRCKSVGIDYRKGACQYNAESVGQSLDPKLDKNGYFNYFEI